MYYLSASDRDLSKSYYCYILFLSFEKSFKYYENVFIPSLYFLGKNFLVNKYKKQICYLENKSLIFDVMKNGQIFSSQISSFQYDHRSVFNRKMANIKTCKQIGLQDLIKFGCSG